MEKCYGWKNEKKRLSDNGVEDIYEWKNEKKKALR
jgi:hypothetical protein